MFYLRIFFIIGISTFLHASDWGYDPPKVLPEDWGTIPGFELCETGTAQSPVDFSQSPLTPKEERVRLRNLKSIRFSYQETSLHMINNGHTLEVEYEPGSTIRLSGDGPFYEILQFHFHAPAEHSFEQGALFAMEMHIVHRDLTNPGQLAVLGVMIKEGAENSVLQTIWEHIDEVTNEEDEFVDSSIHFNIEEALPDDRRYFAYRGSLTTPPCSEVVEWRVLKEPIEMSREQINAFVALLDHSCCPLNGNNRPTQPLNGRSLRLDRIR